MILHTDKRKKKSKISTLATNDNSIHTIVIKV